MVSTRARAAVIGVCLALELPGCGGGGAATADQSTTLVVGWAELRKEAVELHADRAYLIPVMTLDNVSAMREDLVGLKDYMAASEVDLRPLRWHS